jgi:hypothetical protein
MMEAGNSVESARTNSSEEPLTSLMRGREVQVPGQKVRQYTSFCVPEHVGTWKIGDDGLLRWPKQVSLTTTSSIWFSSISSAPVYVGEIYFLDIPRATTLSVVYSASVDPDRMENSMDTSFRPTKNLSARCLSYDSVKPQGSLDILFRALSRLSG